MLNLSFIFGSIYIPKEGDQLIGPIEVQPTPSGSNIPWRLEFLTPIHALRATGRFALDSTGRYFWGPISRELYVHVDTNMNGVSTFYAFTTFEERDFFRTCIQAQGVGGKTALGILAKNSYEDIAKLIAAGDRKAFCKLPGVGPKKGAAICELVFTDSPDQPAESKPITAIADQNVVMALQGLGYAAKMARELVILAQQEVVFSGSDNQEARESAILVTALRLGQKRK